MKLWTPSDGLAARLVRESQDFAEDGNVTIGCLIDLCADIRWWWGFRRWRRKFKAPPAQELVGPGYVRTVVKDGRLYLLVVG